MGLIDGGWWGVDRWWCEKVSSFLINTDTLRSSLCKKYVNSLAGNNELIFIPSLIHGDCARAEKGIPFLVSGVKWCKIFSTL